MESVVSAVSGLEHRGSAVNEKRVHIPVANNTPLKRDLGGSLNDEYWPIIISEWQGDVPGLHKQKSVNEQDKEKVVYPTICSGVQIMIAGKVIAIEIPKC